MPKKIDLTHKIFQNLFVIREVTKEEKNFKPGAWCKENNIPLIRIPFYHLKKLTIKDLSPNTSNFII